MTTEIDLTNYTAVTCDETAFLKNWYLDLSGGFFVKNSYIYSNDCEYFHVKENGWPDKLGVTHELRTPLIVFRYLPDTLVGENIIQINSCWYIHKYMLSVIKDNFETMKKFLDKMDQIGE